MNYYSCGVAAATALNEGSEYLFDDSTRWFVDHIEQETPEDTEKAREEYDAGFFNTVVV